MQIEGSDDSNSDWGSGGTPTRAGSFPMWYQFVISVGDLADHGLVYGSIVIKPRGYAIWSKIQDSLNLSFKKIGVENAYFPLLFPLTLMEKEADFVKGFAKEVALVTHVCLGEDNLKPEVKLNVPLVIRPTSELVIGATVSRWIHSYRDLPLRLNQWANVVRWEKHPRIFLRNSELLWQEGHTFHSNGDEAARQAYELLDIYQEFLEELLAIPGIKGKKSGKERFPGAEETLTYESIMQDGKSLQMCTSHYLGQKFAKMSNIKFSSKSGDSEYVYSTSFGLSTRVIGALVMVHSDDQGFVMPPRIAPVHLIIIPHIKGNTNEVMSYVRSLAKHLSLVKYRGEPLSVVVDDSHHSGGVKDWNAIKKGYPLRLQVGGREISSGRLKIHLRSESREMFREVTRDNINREIPILLEEVHSAIYKKALHFLHENSVKISSDSDFDDLFKKSHFPHKFALVSFNGDPSKEAEIQSKYGVTLRCIPLNQPKERLTCIFSGESGDHVRQVLFARSY